MYVCELKNNNEKKIARQYKRERTSEKKKNLKGNRRTSLQIIIPWLRTKSIGSD